MLKRDISAYNRHEYHSRCNACDEVHTVLTQHHNFPEYETDVYIQCNCGEWVQFILPVN
jgi:hypothetical protein